MVKRGVSDMLVHTTQGVEHNNARCAAYDSEEICSVLIPCSHHMNCVVDTGGFIIWNIVSLCLICEKGGQQTLFR